MSIEQEKEVEKLLWSYTEMLPENEEVRRLDEVKNFFKKNKIPIVELRALFRDKDHDKHLSAINIATKMACRDILRVRSGMN